MISQSTRIAALLGLVAASLGAAESPPRRSLPPPWSPQQLAPFFPDARSQLVGTRPTPDGVARTERHDEAPMGPEVQGPQSSGAAWSRSIDAETLMAEIKRLNNQLVEPLANPSRYKSGGSKLCRRNLAVLAVLFAVAEQFDQSLRVQTSAGSMRHALAKASRNALAATDQSYTEVRQRKADLDDLLRGQSLDIEQPPALEIWSELASRPLLMQRMEEAQQQAIDPSLANLRTFAREAPRVRQEAQLLGVFAQVICRNDYEYGQDETFVEWADQLSEACRDLATAASENNYAAAREAAGRASQSCSACHEDFRG